MEKFKVKGILSALPEEVYKAWLSSAGHTAMTGAKAAASAAEGGSFTAWDGYINGKNVELKKNRLIKQAWRNTEFSESDPDSVLLVTLKKVKAGTEITISHSGIPDGQGKSLKKGWQDYYFRPMKKYLGKNN